ncbi:MAG: hypothetical protein KatS3mg031_2076 [Chitinophagales bacterium]|nr:MAG: hypothetical protein KatS3mg031_2076 [Chitinophagales bacterium]
MKPQTHKHSRKERLSVSRKNPELELCQRLNAGDLSAFVELSRHYAKLIKTVSKKYEHQGLALSEILLYAKIGLLKAAHRYDENKMVSFRLYAIWWMRQAILKALSEKAKIDEIPEILILNLHEILNSFGQHNTENDCTDIANIVENELKELQRIKKRNT